MVDFTSLNDIYHLSMIVIGFGMLILATVTLLRAVKKDKQIKTTKKYLKKEKHYGKH